MDLALNNIQWLIYNKTKPNQTIKNIHIPSIYLSIYVHIDIILFISNYFKDSITLPSVFINFSINIYYVWISSSSSCRAISTDIPDSLSSLLPIVHCFRQVLRATSRIGTELLYVCSSWSSCLSTSMWRVPQEYITYKFVPTSLAVSRMSGSSNFDSFLWWVVGGRTADALWGAVSRTCSILLTAFLWSYRQAFSPYV